MLEVKNVSYAYKTKKDKTILNNVSATFEEGIFYTIIGPSGAGKTTLLSLLAGLDTAVKGTVLCNGEDITKKGLNYHRKHNISLVFQNYNLIDYLTTVENVKLALHWEHRLKNAVNRYNSIFRVQLPKITPHICRHTYCSNQAKAGMNPKTLQYLMGHSDIGVTMNTYTHLGLDDAKNEMIRMEELEQARKEVDKAEDKKPMKQNMFKVV